MQLFVNHISNIDCSCLDPKFGLIGASWIVDIILEGELDYQGMVMDFGDVKKHIKHIIDSSLDHTLLIPCKSNNVRVEALPTKYKVTYQFAKGKIEHISPAEAISLIDVEEISTEVLERYLERAIKESLSEHGLSISIMLREEAIDGASYVYSHGLKQHEGNCQRIAHGHRSRIHIQEAGDRSLKLERYWSDHWNGKYLANRSDIKDTFQEDGIDYTLFSYDALQGRFELTIPSECCSLIDNETTIEHLAQHICDSLSHETDKPLQIFAYEGVNKGAIAGTLNNKSQNKSA